MAESSVGSAVVQSRRVGIGTLREREGIAQQVVARLEVARTHPQRDGETSHDQDRGDPGRHRHPPAGCGARRPGLQLAMEAGEQGLGWGHRVDLEGEVRDRVTERQEGLSAPGAARHVLGEQAVGLHGVVAGKAPERVAGEQLVGPVCLVRVRLWSLAWAFRRRSCRCHTSPRSSVCEHPTELAERRERPRLHRAERDPELLGDPHLRHPSEIGHLEHLSLLCGEVSERFPDVATALGEVVVVHNALRGVFVHDGLEVRRPILARPDPLLAPDRIDRPMMDERRGRRSGRRLWRRRRPPAPARARGRRRAPRPARAAVVP